MSSRPSRPASQTILSSRSTPKHCATKSRRFWHMHEVPMRPPHHDQDARLERLAALRTSRSEVDPYVVAEVVRAVLSTMTGDLTIKETSLLTEVEALGRTIAYAKAEIAALRV